MEVIVASTSKHKIASTHDAFNEAYPNTFINVRGVKAESLINEQPVGHQETLQGALNRLGNAHVALALGNLSFDYIVAMENGIFQVKVGRDYQWFDFGWVALRDKFGFISLAHSAGVEFDLKYVEEARKRGFETTTVGSIIAEQTGADSTDPHFNLTNHLVRRSEMLKQSLMIAIGQHQTKQFI